MSIPAFSAGTAKYNRNLAAVISDGAHHEVIARRINIACLEAVHFGHVMEQGIRVFGAPKTLLPEIVIAVIMGSQN